MNLSNSSKILILSCTGLLSAVALIFIPGHKQSTPSPVATAAAVTVAVAPGFPTRLIIPAIGVDANIQSVGLFWNGDGSMGIPTNFTDVGWYNGGPLPGMPGSAVIDGHLDGKYIREAVFYNLKKLVAGDLVEVVDGRGKTWRFKVLRVAAYAYNATATDVFSGDVSSARLNLITCGGSWIKSRKSYDTRTVVFTELAE